MAIHGNIYKEGTGTIKNGQSTEIRICQGIRKGNCTHNDYLLKL